MTTDLVTTPVIPCWVVELSETLAGTTVQFERVEWIVPRDPADENTEFDAAEPGEPGALYRRSGTYFTMQFDRDDAMAFDVRRHYLLRFDEVLDVTREDEL